VTVLFSEGASEIFTRLPESVKRRAARSIELLASNPRMNPVRRRGIMRGYRYFVAYSILFYYLVSLTEIRISAILPGQMRGA
jgi:plasmid stabilization system protein ParE